MLSLVSVELFFGDLDWYQHSFLCRILSGILKSYAVFKSPQGLGIFKIIFEMVLDKSCHIFKKEFK